MSKGMNMAKMKFPKVIPFPDMGMECVIDKTLEGGYLVFEGDYLVGEVDSYSEAYAVVMECAEGAMA